MRSGQEQSVTLKQKLPVHIGYWTAWVEPDGNVKFTDDPYKLDPIQIQRFHQTRETSTW
jgi:murein L,D-transpeptidase YcbB/YkuD